MAVFKNGIEITRAVVTITSASSPYTAPVNVSDDFTIICNCITAAITVNLPTAVGNSGRVYRIKKIDASANAVTIDPSGAETIDGVASIGIALQYDSYTIQSDGTNWHVI